MTSKTMKAAVFVERGRIELREKPIPEIGSDDALVRVTTTTICGSDIHIRKGEYAVAPGLTIGHEPVGIIDWRWAVKDLKKRGLRGVSSGDVWLRFQTD